jgi:hypothetical protein
MSSFYIGLAPTIYNSQIVSGCIAIIQRESRFLKACGVLGILFLKMSLNLVIKSLVFRRENN